MSDTVTRTTLTERINCDIGYSHAEASDLVDLVISGIIEGLIRDKEVKLSNFGTFTVKHKKKRAGRNPKTKEDAEITERKVVAFHASNCVKARVNKDLLIEAPSQPL